jgi:hypothetical protein
MKKIVVVVLVLLLAIESWGIYGASQVQHVYYTCTWEVGPLCFAWEENAIGKLLGHERSKDIDDALVKARKAWEHDFLERMLEAKKSKESVQKAIDEAAEAAKKGLEQLQDKLKDVTK